jgi:RNA polymerase sigma-70 factor (ECF subfamily)
MGAADEQRLISEAQRGNRDAFRTLVERYMKQAYNIAFGYVKNHDDAADVAQESFVRVHRALRSFHGDAEFGTWLYRIVANLSLNRMKKNARISRREVRLEESLHLAGNIPQDEYKTDRHELLERALHELPTLQRATVILRHLNGFSTRQVSGILRCSEGTVKTHLHRGLKKLRLRLEFLNNE